MAERRTFYVKNFGCRAAQADGAALTRTLRERGLREAADAAAADVVVFNTCTVTADADADARQNIRRANRRNPSAEILVTGCYAQRRPEELLALPGVKWVVGNSHKTEVGRIAAPRADALVGIEGVRPPYHGAAAGGVWVGDIGARRRMPATPVVEPAADRARPNLKIQDGCNNRCSFCIIPAVRGYSRSAPAERVAEELRTLGAAYPEVVLSGINLGRWGRDLPGRPRLTDLLRLVLRETPVRKLRLSSIEPMDWTSELLELTAGEPRLCKHVHIPLQSASDRILRRMRRRYRLRHYADRIERARALMPHAAVGADVMTGFPGETDEDFEATRGFIEQAPFTYLHVFTYSPREGTPAATLPEQVPKAIRKERTRVLREAGERKNEAFRRSQAGREVDAVSLGPAAGTSNLALTDNFLHVQLDRACPPARALRVLLTSDGETAKIRSGVT